MGAGVAANLLKSGQELHVWNRSPASADALQQKGACKVGSPADAFQAEVVFSMLADDAAVEQAVLESGALEQAKPGAIHVNLATVSVALAERLEEAHAEKGVAYVAAPVLGRPDVAEAGRLNALVAGPREAV